MPEGTCRLAVLLSGSGSTLQNIFDRIGDGRLKGVSVELVVSSKADAYGLTRAKERGVKTAVVESKTFRNPETKKTDWEAMSSDILGLLEEARTDLVVLAGYMCMFIVPSSLENRVLNVHPALIPAFSGQGMYGDKVHKAVIERGAKVTGCTVHFVTNEYDAGPIILQKICSVDDDDDYEAVQAKVQALEREAYPEAIQLFADKRLTPAGRRVRIAPSA
eukprot:TRINITY_DN20703_c0_g1_i1.p1 TRINITY_DN20703_c0_g1~~TRINITY_DN20703_c0_g1_i1.p1  ORF type:complete len:236 (+),score=81.55 TRINITY_DN20703_c0_g1_i1:52-708(+)